MIVAIIELIAGIAGVGGGLYYMSYGERFAVGLVMFALGVALTALGGNWMVDYLTIPKIAESPNGGPGSFDANVISGGGGGVQKDTK